MSGAVKLLNCWKIKNLIQPNFDLKLRKYIIFSGLKNLFLNITN
jgi:hypothetical protein